MQANDVLVHAAVIGAAVVACGGEPAAPAGPGVPSTGVGTPCVHEDEESPTYNGSSVGEVVIATLHGSCASGVCVANHFQGRATCPYGQTAEQAAMEPTCFAAGSGDPVTVPVQPQLVTRPAEQTVVCSCRCAGPGAGPFCACPAGTECIELVRALGLPSREDFAGSYCVPAGTSYDPTLPPGETCDVASASCGPLPP